MKIAISGSTGFVGTHLSEFFRVRGHEILPITRQLTTLSSSDELTQIISQCDVVINLAGAPINHRWSRKYKKILYSSRLNTTIAIIRAIDRSEHKPHVFISASAVGIYSTKGCHDESSTEYGDGFLAKLASPWEMASRGVLPRVRLVNARFGVVLSPDAKAFKLVTLPARCGVAAQIGNGAEPFSWISIDDLCRGIEFVIDNESIKGPVNFVAPVKIKNREFTKITARFYNSIFTVRVPKFAFRLAMGEAADLVIQGQCVEPSKLLRAGFVFNNPMIDDFYADLKIKRQDS